MVSVMSKLHHKLLQIKKHLKIWNKTTFGNIFDRITDLERLVTQSEEKFDLDPSEKNKENMKKCQEELHRVLAIEEIYWKQKVNCTWIEEGERNTKYFHSLVKKKRLKSWIHEIHHQGDKLTNPNDIENSATSFFQNLLTAEQVSIDNDLLSHISSCITDYQNAVLCAPPSLEELKDSVYSIHKYSAAGLDGFSSLFFQHSWDIIHIDLLMACNEFFSGVPFPRSFWLLQL